MIGILYEKFTILLPDDGSADSGRPCVELSNVCAILWHTELVLFAYFRGRVSVDTPISLGRMNSQRLREHTRFFRFPPPPFLRRTALLRMSGPITKLISFMRKLVSKLTSFSSGYLHMSRILLIRCFMRVFLFDPYSCFYGKWEFFSVNVFCLLWLWFHAVGKTSTYPFPPVQWNETLFFCDFVVGIDNSCCGFPYEFIKTESSKEKSRGTFR